MTATTGPASVLAALPVRAASYSPSPLHAGDRVFRETNCYLDLWVEVLHAAGQDPRPLLACLLAADHDGEQWVFAKPPLPDLEALAGVRVEEVNVWRPLREHLREHLSRGRLLTVEVDAWWLPDTAGTTYRTEHTKTTVAVTVLEEGPDRLEYVHNAGLFAASGDDVAGLLQEVPGPPDRLVPYVESVALGTPAGDPVAVGAALARHHLGRRAAGDPVARLAERVAADTPWLRTQPVEVFQRWAFGQTRQAGAVAELLADHVAWLVGVAGWVAAAPAEGLLREAAQGLASAQFRLARLARGREVDVSEALAAVGGQWREALDLVAAAAAGG